MHARQVSGVRRYTETDAGIVGAAAQLAQLGLRPKNLRVVKSAVDREIGLIEQVLLPALELQRARTAGARAWSSSTTSSRPPPSFASCCSPAACGGSAAAAPAADTPARRPP